MKEENIQFNILVKLENLQLLLVKPLYDTSYQLIFSLAY